MREEAKVIKVLQVGVTAGETDRIYRVAPHVMVNPVP